MASYRTTRRADADILGLYLSGCRNFGYQSAGRYHAGLAITFDLIAANPRLARERMEIVPPVRLHPYEAHLIVYRIDEGGSVLIIRVLHGRQAWERHLSA